MGFVIRLTNGRRESQNGGRTRDVSREGEESAGARRDDHRRIYAPLKRADLPYHPTSTFVLRRWRTMYVAVNKAACTSLKWMVADLQGENHDGFHRSLSSEVSRAMTIHRRGLWQHTPMAADLSDAELDAISPDSGWFVFAVVRHPAARLFSAWQSKLLLRERWWVERFGDAAWFPRVPRNGDEIVEDFHRFVRALDDGAAHVMANRHFAPQHRLLAVRRMRYSEIYRTTELADLLTDLDRHVRGEGWQGDPPTLPRANSMPLPQIRSLFTTRELAVVQATYRGDFECFGFSDGSSDGSELADSYTAANVEEVGRLIERAERIGDLSQRARQLRQESQPAARGPGRARVIAARVKRRLLRRARG